MTSSPLIISIEGIPGCRKHDIYARLLEKYHLDVKTHHDSDNHQKFLDNPQKYALSYELDHLHRISQAYAENSTPLYDSLKSLKSVYVKLLEHRKLLDPFQLEVFNNLHDQLFIQPHYLIYLYGNLDAGFERATKDEGLLSNFDDYKHLYYEYEWVFDLPNSNDIPMYKVNVEDDIDNVVDNIKAIYDIILTK